MTPTQASSGMGQCFIQLISMRISRMTQLVRVGMRRPPMSLMEKESAGIRLQG